MKRGTRVLMTALGVLVIAAGAPLAAMIAGAHSAPADDAGAVILLGFRLEEDGSPAAILIDRCRAAADYLLAHPDAICVATGGATGGTEVTEAEVMRGLLIGMGVDEARILTEPQARSTGENLALSAALLRERGVAGPVVIVTNGFHQYRAGYFARKNGLEATPLVCRTAPLTAIGYGCREMLAVYKAWVTGQ